MSVSLFFQLLICAASLAVYLVGLEASSFLELSFYVTLSGITVALVPTYLFCLLSENVSLDLGAIGASFYDCAWYQLPVRQQLMFVMPIQRGQQTYHMSGLDLVDCSLRAFTMVSRSFIPPPSRVCVCVGDFDFYSLYLLLRIAKAVKTYFCFTDSSSHVVLLSHHA